ncbi:hypothetical protein ACFDR9_005116 [Janthinobacterium sp. CG_23.3]|uniref:FRG domain-containing protein n=1 Tax=Janthinobacterium sp. CG_23.3 TaxID=3349634 RepID=UPI0038D4CDD7
MPNKQQNKSTLAATAPAEKKTSVARPKLALARNKVLKPSDAAPKTLSSVKDFLDHLEQLNYVKRNLWYRGVGNADYKLLPSLFRNRQATSQPDFQKLERELNETFQNRSVPYTGNSLATGLDWNRLFFMQHYRVPTRLLDWSGSPLVALHFAVTSVHLDESGNPKNDAALWILDPLDWNKCVFAETGFLGGVLSTADSWLNRYSPSEVYREANSLVPVALRGVHNSPRIVAQQGFFTVFGPRAVPMEDCLTTTRDGQHIFQNDCLIKSDYSA